AMNAELKVSVRAGSAMTISVSWHLPVVGPSPTARPNTAAMPRMGHLNIASSRIIVLIESVTKRCRRHNATACQWVSSFVFDAAVVRERHGRRRTRTRANDCGHFAAARGVARARRPGSGPDRPDRNLAGTESYPRQLLDRLALGRAHAVRARDHGR